MSHQVTILWGEAPDPGDENWETYHFATKAELDAFIMGVAEMDGWLGYESFEHAEDCVARINDIRGDAGVMEMLTI